MYLNIIHFELVRLVMLLMLSPTQWSPLTSIIDWERL